MNILLSVTLLCLIMLSSCNEIREPISPEDVNNTYSSGVVLIGVKYCHVMEMENGVKFYFTDFDKDGDLNFTTNQEEAPVAFHSGSGFFISSDGQIATNSHVAYPEIDEKKALAYFHTQSERIKSQVRKEIANLSDKISRLQERVASKYVNETRTQAQQDSLVASLAEARAAREKAQKILDTFDELSHLNGSLSTVAEIGVAYNNTFVDKISDFIPCVQLKDSKDYDVAIIQLKSKQTPNDRYIFDVEKPVKSDGYPAPDKNGKEIDVDEPSVGSKLYLIGFNHGLTIGTTAEGIKAQVVSGDVSQTVDDKEIMYTIPTLGGSSGSPVLNEYGDLVAVNHAGWNGTQGFNYGIRAIHLRELYHKKK